VTELVVVRNAAALREVIGAWRLTSRSVALVPTMGNLHRGHIRLAQHAAMHAERVVMTIFVNPTQFGEGEDYASYPRTLDEDERAVRAAATIDALFIPEVVDLYPFGLEEAVQLEMPPLSRELCGASRAGHFNGVASVVLRLLNISQPDWLVLGEKDFQQLILIERLIADLCLPVRVLGVPIERDTDGLALSSRNRYLTVEERQRAPNLHRVLEAAAESIRGGKRSIDAVTEQAGDALDLLGFKVDYVEVRDARDLSRPNGLSKPADLIVLGAAWLGGARLIDNVRV
jgi:pantoate--beta-alanine ligase